MSMDIPKYIPVTNVASASHIPLAAIDINSTTLASKNVSQRDPEMYDLNAESERLMAKVTDLVHESGGSQRLRYAR